jgi:hypothetical protein
MLILICWWGMKILYTIYILATGCIYYYYSYYYYYYYYYK